MYGYTRHDGTVEISSVWVSVEVDLQAVSLPRAQPAASDPAPIDTRTVIFAHATHDTPVFHRDQFGAGAKLTGPAVIEQLDATTIVWPKQTLRTDDFGQLVLGPQPGASA